MWVAGQQKGGAPRQPLTHGSRHLATCAAVRPAARPAPCSSQFQCCGNRRRPGGAASCSRRWRRRRRHRSARLPLPRAGLPASPSSSAGGSLMEMQDETVATCAILLPQKYPVKQGATLWGGVRLGRLLGAGVQVRWGPGCGSPSQRCQGPGSPVRAAPAGALRTRSLGTRPLHSPPACPGCSLSRCNPPPPTSSTHPRPKCLNWTTPTAAPPARCSRLGTRVRCCGGGGALVPPAPAPSRRVQASRRVERAVHACLPDTPHLQTWGTRS